MATCPEAAAEKLAFETALHLTLPPLPTDRPRGTYPGQTGAGKPVEKGLQKMQILR